MPKSIRDLVLEYFKNHPDEDIPHSPVVDWVTQEYLKYNNHPPRDPWRTIRGLYQEGILIKVKKGVYRYDPDFIKNRELFDFSPEIKEKIFERDGYRCVICHRGPEDGVEICADHKLSKDRGGDNSLDNGQTLCMEHNLMKKNYSQTEAAKRYFIKLYETAVKINDLKMINFCKDIFDIYDKHKIDAHIRRPDV